MGALSVIPLSETGQGLDQILSGPDQSGHSRQTTLASRYQLTSNLLPCAY